MATVNLQVSNGDDDGRETAAGSVDINNTDDTISVAGSWFGFRFRNVTVPQGSTVNSATLQVYVNSTDHDDAHVDIHGDDADDSAVFTTDNFDISGRTDTTAKVDWDSDGVGTGFTSAPDVASIVQEIVNRGSWASGNAMSILVEGMASVDLGVRMYEYAGNADGAKLDIDYTAPAGGAVQAMNHFRRLREQ